MVKGMVRVHTFIQTARTYAGEWKDGEYSGQGTLTYADGEQWAG